MVLELLKAFELEQLLVTLGRQTCYIFNVVQSESRSQSHGCGNLVSLIAGELLKIFEQKLSHYLL